MWVGLNWVGQSGKALLGFLRRIDTKDVHLYGGTAAVAVGVGFWSPPAALVWVGAVFFVVGAVLYGLEIHQKKRG